MLDKRNCALTFSRCNERVLLFTKHWWVKLVPLQAAARGGARPSPHSNIFVFKSLQGWGGHLQLKLRAVSRSFLRCFLTWLSLRCEGHAAQAETRQTSLMNYHHHNRHQYLAKFLILHRKKRGSNQCFRYEYFDIVMLLTEIFYNHNECDLISSQDDQIPWMFSVYHNKN